MQKNLVDYSVYYKKEDIKIPNVINACYEEINNGFNANNEVNYVINVKILFVDANGLLRCLEDDADQFVFYDETGYQEPILPNDNKIIETITIS